MPRGVSLRLSLSLKMPGPTAEDLAEYKEENRGVAQWLYGAKRALGDDRDAPALSRNLAVQLLGLMNLEEQAGDTVYDIRDRIWESLSSLSDAELRDLRGEWAHAGLDVTNLVVEEDADEEDADGAARERRVAKAVANVLQLPPDDRVVACIELLDKMPLAELKSLLPLLDASRRAELEALVREAMAAGSEEEEAHAAAAGAGARRGGGAVGAAGGVGKRARHGGVGGLFGAGGGGGGDAGGAFYGGGRGAGPSEAALRERAHLFLAAAMCTGIPYPAGGSNTAEELLGAIARAAFSSRPSAAAPTPALFKDLELSASSAQQRMRATEDPQVVACFLETYHRLKSLVISIFSEWGNDGYGGSLEDFWREHAGAALHAHARVGLRPGLGELPTYVVVLEGILERAGRHDLRAERMSRFAAAEADRAPPLTAPLPGGGRSLASMGRGQPHGGRGVGGRGRGAGAPPAARTRGSGLLHRPPFNSAEAKRYALAQQYMGVNERGEALPSVCVLCGRSDHWARDCPHNKVGGFWTNGTHQGVGLPPRG